MIIGISSYKQINLPLRSTLTGVIEQNNVDGAYDATSFTLKKPTRPSHCILYEEANFFFWPHPGQLHPEKPCKNEMDQSEEFQT